MSDVVDPVAPSGDESVFFEAVWNSADVGMCVTDANRRFVKVNDAYCKLYRYDRTELVGHEFTKVLPEEMRAYAADIHDAFIAGALESAGEWQVLRRDGATVDVQVTAARVVTGGQTYKVTTVIDISTTKANQRQLEEQVSTRTAALTASEKRYRTLLENFPNGSVMLFDRDLRYTLVSGTEWQRLSIDPQTMIGKTMYDLFDNALIDQLEPVYQATLKGESSQHDMSFAGQLYSTHFVPIYAEGSSQVDAGMMMSQRITEQRRAANALKENEARLRTLLANMPVVLFSTDKHGVYTLFEGRDLASMGRSSGDVVGESLFERYPDDTELLTNVRTALAGEAVTFESYVASTDQYFDNIYTPIYDANNEPNGMIGLAVNTTEHKRIARALTTNEQRLRMIVANLPIVIFTTDQDGIFTLSEGKGLANIGLVPGQVVGQSLFSLYKDMQGISEAAKRALEGTSTIIETQVAGQAYENYISPLYDESANISGVLGVAYDITERKHAAEQLEHTNIRLAKLNDLNNQLKAVDSIDGILACVADYFGYLGRGAAFGLSYIDLDEQGVPKWATFTATHLDQANIQHSPIGKRTQLDEFPSSDIWLANMNNATFFMDIVNDTRLDDNTKDFFKTLNRESLIFIPLINQNRWIGVVTVGWEHQQPLTDELIEVCAALPTTLAPVVEVIRLVAELEQTLAERTHDLQQSQALLDGFFIHAPGAVWVKDLNLRFMRANNASEIFYNRPAPDVIGLSDADIFETTQADEFASPERQVIDTKQAVTFEEDAPSTLGTRNLLTTKFPIFDKSGDLIAIGGFSTDITEMRREVHESQNLLRLVIDNMPGVVVWKDRDLNFLGANKNFAKITGFASPDDLIGKTDFDTTTNQEAAAGYRRDDLEVMRSGQAKLNFEEVSPASNSTWLRTSKLPLRNEQGEVVGLLGLAEDITEQKAAAEKLQAYRNQLAKAEAELDITRRIQELLIPSNGELAAIHNLDIAGFMSPAEEVGGDYYDVLHYGDGLTIGIGDVTGHGLESGLLMLMTQTAVRTLIASGEHDPARFFEVLNVTLYDNLQRMHADKSMTIARLDYQEVDQGGSLRISGQHEHLLVLRNTGEVEVVDTLMLGLPVGLEPSIKQYIAEHSLLLAQGDGIVIYTDGITEAENVAAEQYGLERLCSVVSKYWHQPAKAISEHVVADVNAHIAGHTIFDDMSLVVLKQQ
jgi:PAS domain S-box-containing protein